LSGIIASGENRMTRKPYPEYHKALLDRNLYPSAPRRIKFEETRRCFLYKTGEHIYKIRKPSPIYSSLAVKEVYSADSLRLGKLWADDCYEAVVPVVRTDGSYALSGAGTVVDYALRMKQLAGHCFCGDLLASGKLTANLVGRVARFLAEQHQAHAVGESAAELGRPEHFRSLFEEVSYQVKKYVGQVLSEAMYEIIMRPVERFIGEERKLFLRRQKRERIVEGHGAFVPEHLCLRGKDVLAISPLGAPSKFRLLDAANDVGTFRNGLRLAGAAEAEDWFLKRYVAASRDRDLPRMVPAYEVLQALRSGLEHCEWRVEVGEGSPEFSDITRKAQAYFNLAVHRAREVPREL
jgi:aminoglycoside phosphotransferase family enzyme